MIDRRGFLTGAIASTGLDTQPAEAAGSGLNVLFLAVDDLRPELGCYGNDLVHAPNLDRFASSSLVFQRAYCQSAVCGPSRASLLTGLRPDTTRVWGNRTHFRETMPDLVTLPQRFKQSGYYTPGNRQSAARQQGRPTVMERAGVADRRPAGRHAVRR